MFKFLRRKQRRKGPLVYLSEPTILYHTKTEKAILEIIEEKLGSTNVIVPSDYGLRDVSHRIREAEYLVAVAPLGKFTTLVCREVKKARGLGVKVYTLTVARKDNELLYLFEEGVPDHIEWLDEKETREFLNEFLGSEFMDTAFRGFFLGSRRREW
ncbi:hypothetical protein [Pyrococcus yayanosii]|uniref:Uncharacterized protein n=1 Tax=Pyrococcus yayanosii (strain CH1 / JCM 16557) TaxID=529709 RepID=F8AGM7_PYRYC|nr:hypothetical protein [Pyrococcus yayanosii]AEH23998.1 hypothetical protein PYCH_03010 [Pyrococcus yayanosii CH1]